MVQILQGDCRDVLATLAAGSVQMCVTSPPYFGLRDYGVDGQLGLEATPDAYIAALVEVFKGVRRVLRDDGTLWVNIGDSYATNPGNGRGGEQNDGGVPHRSGRDKTGMGVKTKDLIGIPWMLAFALRADGWYLRSDIIWSKPNVMPESVRDRPTKAHEYLFLLSKHERYYYDAAAIAEAPATSTQDRSYLGKRPITPRQQERQDLGMHGKSDSLQVFDRPTRNKRSVWTVATTPYAGAHFATFPEKLIEPCILAGSSPMACEVCGAPWARVVERDMRSGREAYQDIEPTPKMASGAGVRNDYGTNKTGLSKPSWRTHAPDHTTTTGWQPTCDHDNAAGTGRCIVLDPFGGSGTTARVAAKHQRDAILIELNPSYIEQAEVRTDGVQTTMLV